MASRARRVREKQGRKWMARRKWLRATSEAPASAALARRGQTVRRRLLAWYQLAGRDFPWRASQATIYQQIVSEVLLQQTAAVTVSNNYESFFRRFPSWWALATASIPELEDALRPLGLWRRRARSLHALGFAVVDMGGLLPSDRPTLENIPAVGQYVANAILLFEHGLPEPLLDVNMGRVLERYFGIKTRADLRHDEFLQSAARACISGRNPAVVNWSFLDLGSQICKSRSPACGSCPIVRGCYFASTQRK